MPPSDMPGDVYIQSESSFGIFPNYPHQLPLRHDFPFMIDMHLPVAFAVITK